MTAISTITAAPVFTFLRCEIFQSFQDASEVEILFNLNGKKSKTSISAKDVLNYLQFGGKYSHEGFAVDMDGIYYVKEYQVNGDHEGIVNVDLDAKIRNLSSKDWNVIIAEIFKYVNPIHFHLYNI
jgi:hypothetical protein